MISCIYCGLCEEVCPEQAIFLRKDYAITGITRAEMVHDKAKLYELGGVFTGLVHKWNPKNESDVADPVLPFRRDDARFRHRRGRQPQPGRERAQPRRFLPRTRRPFRRAR